MPRFISGYCAIVGAPNVGKSTLLNRILGQKISITGPKPQTTRNRIVGIHTEETRQIIFLDTPGIHRARDPFNRRMVETAVASLRDVDAVAFLVDATFPDDDRNTLVLSHLKGLETPVILVVNKIDLVKKPALLPVIERYRGEMDFRAVVPLSAAKGDGVPEFIEEVSTCLPEGPRYFPPDQISDQPERFIVSEIIREKVFELIHQEIPYGVAVTIDTFEEGDDMVRIKAAIHVERDSQKAIVIGKGGEMLKRIGTRARKDIETLLAAHVFLGLFVRVQKDWRRDARSLSEFGYEPGR